MHDSERTTGNCWKPHSPRAGPRPLSRRPTKQRCPSAGACPPWCSPCLRSGRQRRSCEQTESPHRLRTTGFSGVACMVACSHDRESAQPGEALHAPRTTRFTGGMAAGLGEAAAGGAQQVTVQCKCRFLKTPRADDEPGTNARGSCWHARLATRKSIAAHKIESGTRKNPTG